MSEFTDALMERDEEGVPRWSRAYDEQRAADEDRLFAQHAEAIGVAAPRRSVTHAVLRPTATDDVDERLFREFSKRYL